MPEIPVGPEAGLLGRLVNGLFRVPAEDAFARELPVLARAAPSPAEFPSLHVDLHAQLVDAVKNGRDTSQLTRRVLTGAGPEGVGAFQTLDRYGEKIEYSRGGGSFHNTATGVHIDLDNGYAALSLVHEATHVRWVRAGRRAMVGKMGRSDFIDAMLVEETDAAVHKICANIYMQNMHHIYGCRTPDCRGSFSPALPRGFERRPRPLRRRVELSMPLRVPGRPSPVAPRRSSMRSGAVV